MADITAAMVKELREKTGAGMMDAKGALVLKGEYNGVSIDVADLPKGLYNLLVSTPEGNTSSKTWIKK